MKHSKKVCAHDKVIVASNGDYEIYLNYETSIDGILIGNVCVRCHDSEALNSFRILEKIYKLNYAIEDMRE